MMHNQALSFACELSSAFCFLATKQTVINCEKNMQEYALNQNATITYSFGSGQKHQSTGRKANILLSLTYGCAKTLEDIETMLLPGQILSWC